MMTRMENIDHNALHSKDFASENIYFNFSFINHQHFYIQKTVDSWIVKCLYLLGLYFRKSYLPFKKHLKSCERGVQMAFKI